MAKIRRPNAGGLDFMQGAVAAMPSSIGEHMRASVLCDLMTTAIECRFKFSKEDAEPLSGLSFRCQYGVFSPLDYYAMACSAGGTYPKMWESHFGFKPWIALQALVSTRTRGKHSSVTSLKEKQRVAEGICVLFPLKESDEESDLECYEGKALWKCTSISKDDIILCRYRRKSQAFESNRTPAKRMKLSREEWASLNITPAAVAENTPSATE